MRMLWEPLLNTYGVDLVLHGHVHSYERSNPVNNYQTGNQNQLGVHLTTLMISYTKQAHLALA